MILKIISDHLCGYFIAHCSSKISVFPKLSTPKLFFFFGMLFEYYTGTDTLEHPYHLGDTISGWKRQKDMDMVLRYLKGIYLKIVALGYFFKYLFCSISDVFSQNPLSIFRGPHKMIRGVIDRMAGSLQFHAVSITYVSLPSAGELFIPVYKTGYSSSGFA
jgi:hypothetical protein